MNKRVLTAIISATALIGAAVIKACMPASAVQTASVSQISTGANSPNISTTGSLSVSYGTKDCYLEQWSVLLKEQGKSAQQIDARIAELSQILNRWKSEISIVKTSKDDAARVLRYVELGDFVAAEILIRQAKLNAAHSLMNENDLSSTEVKSSSTTTKRLSFANSVVEPSKSSTSTASLNILSAQGKLKYINDRSAFEITVNGQHLDLIHFIDLSNRHVSPGCSFGLVHDESSLVNDEKGNNGRWIRSKSLSANQHVFIGSFLSSDYYNRCKRDITANVRISGANRSNLSSFDITLYGD